MSPFDRDLPVAPPCSPDLYNSGFPTMNHPSPPMATVGDSLAVPLGNEGPISLKDTHLIPLHDSDPLSNRLNSVDVDTGSMGDSNKSKEQNQPQSHLNYTPS